MNCFAIENLKIIASSPYLSKKMCSFAQIILINTDNQ